MRRSTDDYGRNDHVQLWENHIEVKDIKVRKIDLDPEPTNTITARGRPEPHAEA